MKTRNIAIIAHVDHGKTTLVDKLIKTATNQNKSMDSNDLEKERGITILAKNTSIHYKEHLINILDTPGHADFSGEVERIMSMVDGVLLIVDAFEGTMPQTRFVLKQALETKKQVIVIINKVDRPNIDLDDTLNKVFDLFIELGADDEQLEFPILYISALKETSSNNKDLNTQVDNLNIVLDTVIDYIKEPDSNNLDTLQMQISLLDYNEYVGRIGIGLIKSGTIKVNETVSIFKNDKRIDFRVQKIIGYHGLEKVELKEASKGMIVSISGLPTISVGDTVCSFNIDNSLPPIHISEPTLKMTFMANDSPFVGKDGSILTGRKIEERLFKECEKDVSLKIEKSGKDSFVVCGRGELHLSILIENMRREGFELQVLKPEVILKEIDGVTMEPYEDLYIEVPEEYVGSVIDFVGRRGATLLNMKTENTTKLHFDIPSRGLIGFNTEFLSITKGYGIVNHSFLDYRKENKEIKNTRSNGVLVSNGLGKATSYRLKYLEERGIMFVAPGEEVYSKMIIGENNKDNDLYVNVIEQKQMSNMRQANKDNTVVLKKPRKLSLEYCLGYINSDEMVEITPHFIRMRKK